MKSSLCKESRDGWIVVLVEGGGWRGEVKGKLPHYFSTTPSYVKLKFSLSEIDIDKWFVIIINIHWRLGKNEISIKQDSKVRDKCLFDGIGPGGGLQISML